MTPLLLATSTNNLEVVKGIVELGRVNIYSQCRQLNNVLHYAIQTHNKDLIRYILDCDAENNYLRKEPNARG